MKNDRKKEFETWQSLIHPIIDAYGITGIQYRHIPVEYTDIGIIKIERWTNQLCNKRPFDSFRQLMLRWRNGITDNAFPYQRSFIDFINHLLEKETLPHFLEFLY